MKIPDIESVNYKRSYYEINEFSPPKDIDGFLQQGIRKSILENNDDWKKLVDVSIQDDVENYLKINS